MEVFFLSIQIYFTHLKFHDINDSRFTFCQMITSTWYHILFVAFSSILFRLEQFCPAFYSAKIFRFAFWIVNERFVKKFTKKLILNFRSKSDFTNQSFVWSFEKNRIHKLFFLKSQILKKIEIRNFFFEMTNLEIEKKIMFLLNFSFFRHFSFFFSFWIFSQIYL